MSRKLDFHVDSENKVWYDEDIHIGDIRWCDLLEVFEFSPNMESTDGFEAHELLQIALLLGEHTNKGGC